MVQFQYGKKFLKDSIIEIWKLCFPYDTEEFRTLYFEKVYQDDEVLILLEDNRVIASLQMIPYQIKFGDKIYPAAYISGAMTHPDFQEKGYMGKLLNHAFEEMKRKKIPITFLIPQNDQLFDFYSKHGYQKAFTWNSNTTFEIKNKEFEKNRFFQYKSMEEVDLEGLYSIYSDFLNKKENAVTKTIQQFSLILEDVFIDKGAVFIGKNGIALTIPDESNSSVILKEYFCPPDEKDELLSAIAYFSGKNKIVEMNSSSGEFSHYWGMLRILDESISVSKNIYMNTMLN